MSAVGQREILIQNVARFFRNTLNADTRIP